MRESSLRFQHSVNGFNFPALSRAAATLSAATAAREFADNPGISDEIIGFHAQQAVEQRTHDFDQLCRLLEEQGVDLPAPRSSLAELTDFAVPLRYEDLLDAEPLDRPAAVRLVDEVGKWAADQLS